MPTVSASHRCVAPTALRAQATDSGSWSRGRFGALSVSVMVRTLLRTFANVNYFALLRSAKKVNFGTVLWTSQQFASTMSGVEPTQRPEGALIERALRAHTPRLSARAAADRAGISEARWRQIVSGSASGGRGVRISVTGPPDTIARMARAVGATAEQLEAADRADAAEVLREMDQVAVDAELSARERLDRAREEVANLRYATPREKRLLLAIIDAEREENITRTSDRSLNPHDTAHT